MTFATDLKLPEGPVALPDGSFLVVEGGRGCVTHISPDGQSKRIIAVTGEPNGLAVDKTGAIWVADIRPPALIRLTMDGKFERILTGCKGEPFLFPNDLCFGPDGALYLTDSGILNEVLAPDGAIRPDWADLKMDGRLYKVHPHTFEIEKLDSGFQFTNGICFGADQQLYVNDLVTGMVYRYPWQDGKLIGPREDFGNVHNPSLPPAFRGPDGMAFDSNGKLYVAVYAQGDVTVLGKDGGLIERIPTPGNLPTNLCFGLPGQKKIYVTEYEQGCLECFDVDADGLALWG
ncbi:MAG: SMP-30/gluconolactonase/LRE family protein [Blastocatellia bacterium]